MLLINKSLDLNDLQLNMNTKIIQNTKKICKVNLYDKFSPIDI